MNQKYQIFKEGANAIHCQNINKTNLFFQCRGVAGKLKIVFSAAGAFFFLDLLRAHSKTPTTPDSASACQAAKPTND